MDYDTLFLEDNDFQLPKLQVQSLRLPNLIIDVEDIDDLGTLSEKFGQGLVEQDLGTTSFHTYALPTAGLAESYDISRSLLVPSQPDFPKLRSVTLRGFVLVSTLRTLRLIDCLCRDTYDAFNSFAKDTVAPALALTGVEIYGLRFDNATFNSADSWIRFNNEQFLAMRREDQILDEDFPAMRPNNRVWDTEALRKRSKTIKMDMVAAWPYERFELEATMLRGRVDHVARHVRTERKSSARSYWYDVQMFYA